MARLLSKHCCGTASVWIGVRPQRHAFVEEGREVVGLPLFRKGGQDVRVRYARRLSC